MPFYFGDESFNSGDSTAVNCMISKGDLPLNIKWALNSQPIVNGQHGVVILKISSRLSSLSINSISGEQRGIFKCIAENDAGSDEYESELKVNGIHLLLKFHLMFFFCFSILSILKILYSSTANNTLQFW